MRVESAQRANSSRRYVTYWDASLVDNIARVRRGIPAKMLDTFAVDMRVPKEQVYEWARISRATANRKLKAGDTLSLDESERALGIARLIGQVEKIVTESGTDPTFNAALWTAEWLKRPNPALGSKLPGEFLDTADGRALVSALVSQMQSGAYA